MTRLVDSLYSRLALVLLVALLAGFGTMYGLFRSHTDDTRVRNYARSIAVQIRLMEELLRSHPDVDAHPVGGTTVVHRPPTAPDPDADQSSLLERLREPLQEELGRAPAAAAVGGAAKGLWIALAGVPQGERWMFFPAPKRRPRPESWTWALWTSFAVVLVGGMSLLWGVHRPLRRLEQGIRRVASTDAPAVQTEGPREIRAVAEQFNEMLERLRRFDRDRAVMLAGVAHDLRAPLTRLRLQLELDDSPRHAAMAANLDGMGRIVDQFLAFAQDADPEAPVRFDLAALARETAAAYGGRVGLPGDADAMELPVEARPATLQRAIGNLIDNALEYGAPPVILDCRRADGRALVRVSDAGPGIPAERIGEALRPFSRLDTARPGAGHCGLGLAIAARVAGAHGGTLTLEGAAPRGLAATIALPIAS